MCNTILIGRNWYQYIYDTNYYDIAQGFKELCNNPFNEEDLK